MSNSTDSSDETPLSRLLSVDGTIHWNSGSYPITLHHSECSCLNEKTRSTSDMQSLPLRYSICTYCDPDDSPDVSTNTQPDVPTLTD